MYQSLTTKAGAAQVPPRCEHFVVNGLAQSRADGPRAVFAEHVRGDAEIALKDRHRADRLVGIQLRRKNRLADRIDQGIAAIQQISAVKHAQQLAVVAQERNGGGGNHAVFADLFSVARLATVGTSSMRAFSASFRPSRASSAAGTQRLPVAGRFCRMASATSGLSARLSPCCPAFWARSHDLSLGIRHDQQVHLPGLKGPSQQRSRLVGR